MRVAVFGGTFDPPHVGHENIVAKLIDRFDKVIIVPSKVTPNKENQPMASSSQRMKMLSLCSFSNNSNCMISSYEIDSNKSPSYTIDTIRHIKNKFKTSEIHVAIGLDQLNNLNSWHKWDCLKSIVKFICFNRFSKKINKKCLVDCEFINDFDYNISSSDIRRLVLAETQNFKGLINDNVFNYIINESLYK